LMRAVVLTMAAAVMPATVMSSEKALKKSH
jgi:hypothetical protein